MTSLRNIYIIRCFDQYNYLRSYMVNKNIRKNCYDRIRTKHVPDFMKAAVDSHPKVSTKQLGTQRWYCSSQQISSTLYNEANAEFFSIFIFKTFRIGVGVGFDYSTMLKSSVTILFCIIHINYKTNTLCFVGGHNPKEKNE